MNILEASWIQFKFIFIYLRNTRLFIIKCLFYLLPTIINIQKAQHKDCALSEEIL